MTRYHKALGLFLVTMFGLWGCARGPASQSTASTDRIKSLEAKNIKLEDELKAASTDRDLIRKQLSESQAFQARLQLEIEELKLVVKERDDLVVQLKSRTTERDQLQVQYDSFRRNLKDLIGQADAAMEMSKSTPAGLASRRIERPAAPNGN